VDIMKDALVALLGGIAETAKETVESFFMVDAELKDDWAVEERLSGEFDHIITLGCSNSDYQGVIMVASGDDHVSAFFEEKEELVDIYGELANTYCGMLMDCPGVVEQFGVLSQAVPMYAAKRAFFPRAWAVTGKVFVGESWVQIGFAVRGFAMLINR